MMIFIYVLTVIAFLILLGNLFTFILQDLFIFRPLSLPADHAFDFEVPFEEIDLPSEAGGQLNCLLFRLPERSEARGVVLYFHGNSGNLQRWGNLYHFFFQHKYDLFIFDYRGFGKSRGKRTERLMYEDAQRVYNHLLGFYESDKITIFGRSIGSAFACRVAAEQPARAMILETPFSAMNDLFFTYFPFLPRVFLFKYRFLNRDYLKKVDCPVYIFQGTADIIVPETCAARLKPMLKKTDRYFSIELGRHNDLMIYELYQQQMARILNA